MASQRNLLGRWLFSTLVTGTMLGAGLMFLLDPMLGRGRRARLLEKGVKARHRTMSHAHKAVRHLRNRSKGMVARLRPAHIRKVVLRARTA
ncbi:MAG TPA: hypothetical protein VIH99_11795 [Bdellovibrionota bacterium]